MGAFSKFTIGPQYLTRTNVQLNARDVETPMTFKGWTSCVWVANMHVIMAMLNSPYFLGMWINFLLTLHVGGGLRSLQS